MAFAIATNINSAAQLERDPSLSYESHQRAPERQGCVNGFTPKKIQGPCPQTLLLAGTFGH